MNEIPTKQLDDECVALFLEVPASKVVLLQGIIECYEGLGVVRTLDRSAHLICILTTPAMLDVCKKVLVTEQESLQWRVPADIPSEEDPSYYIRTK